VQNRSSRGELHRARNACQQCPLYAHNSLRVLEVRAAGHTPDASHDATAAVGSALQWRVRPHRNKHRAHWTVAGWQAQAMEQVKQDAARVAELRAARGERKQVYALKNCQAEAGPKPRPAAGGLRSPASAWGF
jgi:hypothetical protein